MKTREIGNTKIQISEVGLGCWQLGNTEDWENVMSDDEGVQLVHEALNLGCNFFDTAPPYAKGNSEKILGKALIGKRQDAVICTKFGYTHDYKVDFTIEGLKRSLDSSLQRLNTDYIDVFLVHNPPDDFYNNKTEHFELLDSLKDQGVIRAYGVSADTTSHIQHLMSETDSQVFEIPYSIFSQAIAPLFDEIHEKGIGLISKVPLDSGPRSGKYTKETSFNGARARWTDTQKAIRADLLNELLSIIGEESLVDLALKFSISHPAVASTIPGTKNLKQLNQNLTSIDTEMSKDMVSKLHEFWRTHVATAEYSW